jgi:hypothetical protein
MQGNVVNTIVIVYSGGPKIKCREMGMLVNR